MDIQDRIALVTSAGMGTGQAISQRLAERGAMVVLTDVYRRVPRRHAESARRAAELSSSLPT